MQRILSRQPSSLDVNKMNFNPDRVGTFLMNDAFILRGRSNLIERNSSFKWALEDVNPVAAGAAGNSNSQSEDASRSGRLGRRPYDLTKSTRSSTLTTVRPTRDEVY